ncbi:MAG: heme lyase CcmF/NrfE family subunit [Anaerolineales bacterium]
MLVEFGIAALFFAFVATLLGILFSLYGAFTAQATAIAAGRNALWLSFPLLTIVCSILIYAQVTGMYELSYVSSVSKDAQPDTLKVTALWGGQAGSLAFWSWTISLFIGAALILNWKTEYKLMPWVMVVTGGTLAFFLLMNNFFENPFARTWAMPDDSIQTAVLQPDGAQIAYPYQYSGGQTYFTEPDATFPMAPEARMDGRGLSPLLRHPGMIIHPPLLYLGFTGFVIPFAFAVAALARGDLGLGWLRATRRWSLIAWLFLTLGIVLGGRWAYDVLGWGGYWGWDPVENSSLLPWLTGTAFLHSVMIQERRGMLKGWNIFMIILTYLLMLFGTVATRTGLLSSVHSFAQSPLAIPMGLFLGTTMILCLGLFLWRGQQNAFKSDHELESMISRESLFLFNNWVFLAITLVVFWGTWSELVTGLLRDAGLMGNTINLGREYYETITPWLFLVLFILMGVAPLAAWRKASVQRLGRAAGLPTLLAFITTIASVVFLGEPIVALGIGIVAFAGFATLLEFYKGAEARRHAHGENWFVALGTLIGRNRRRYGGYIIHLSVVIMGLGIIASTAFQEVRQETLNPGDTIDIADYTVRYEQMSEAIADDDRSMLIVDVALLRDDEFVTRLRPRRDFFGQDSSPMTIAGVHSTIENDVYVLLTFFEGNQVTLRVYRNPLVSLVWWGAFLMIVGTVVAVFPKRERKTVTQPTTPHVKSQPIGAVGD